MNTFPIEIVARILDFGTSIRYRNGKFMDQINKEDDRYKILENLSPITTIYFNDRPWRYIRYLGNYSLILNITPGYRSFRYEIIFRKTKQETNNTITILYYYEMK